jgi:thiamine-monophosphate kinase
LLESLSNPNPEFIKAHQYPVPQLAIGQQIRDFATACMDSSDGLADAVLQLCQRSNVGAHITQLPIPQALVAHPQAQDWTLYGGEDFELVFCCPIAAAQAFVALCPTASIVGHITSEPIVQLCDSRFASEVLTRDRGFQHFAPP